MPSKKKAKPTKRPAKEKTATEFEARVTALTGSTTSPLSSSSIEQGIKKMKPRYYAFIEHLNEMNDDGSIKATHYHIVMALPKPESLTDFSSNLEKSLNVSHASCHEDMIKKSLNAVLRYLTHEDQPEKQHYDRKLVKTNNEAWYRDNSLGAITTWKVKEDIANGHTINDFISDYGIESTNRFRSLITSMVEDHYYMRDKNLNQKVNELENLIAEKDNKIKAMEPKSEADRIKQLEALIAPKDKEIKNLRHFTEMLNGFIHKKKLDAEFVEYINEEAKKLNMVQSHF